MQIKKSIKALFLSFLLIFPIMLSGCNPSSKISTDKPNPQSKPAMWEVTSKDGATKLYLFGSIHAADKTAYPLRAEVATAFNKSDYLAVECDIVAFQEDLVRQMESSAGLVYTDGTTIEDHIPSDTYEKVKKILTDNDLYMSVYDKMKPSVWSSLLDNLLVKKSGLNADLGIDTYLLKQAKQSKKKILEIESVEFQMDMLSNFSDEIQALMLKSYTDDFNKQVDMLKELYTNWNSGDIENLSKMSDEEDDSLTDAEKVLYEQYNKVMLTDRNVGMVTKAEQYLSEGKNTFFVVGAMHMVGDKGIVAQLKAKGYTVTPM